MSRQLDLLCQKLRCFERWGVFGYSILHMKLNFKLARKPKRKTSSETGNAKKGPCGIFVRHMKIPYRWWCTSTYNLCRNVHLKYGWKLGWLFRRVRRKNEPFLVDVIEVSRNIRCKNTLRKWRYLLTWRRDEKLANILLGDVGFPLAPPRVPVALHISEVREF